MDKQEREQLFADFIRGSVARAVKDTGLPFYKGESFRTFRNKSVFLQKIIDDMFYMFQFLLNGGQEQYLSDIAYIRKNTVVENELFERVLKLLDGLEQSIFIEGAKI